MIVSFIDFVEGLPVLIHMRRVPDNSQEANSYIALGHIRSEQKEYILSCIMYFINISIGETIE